MVLEPFRFQDNPQNGEMDVKVIVYELPPQPNPLDEAWRLH
jgi:hypothetical protein